MLSVLPIRNFNLSPANTAVRKMSQTSSDLQYRYNMTADMVSFKGSSNKGDKKVFACTDSSELAKKVASISNLPLSTSSSKKHKNGETYVRLEEPVENKVVYVMSSGQDPINDNLMEFLQMVDASKRNGAEKVVAILPYMPYSRQDRLSKPGESLAATMVAKDIQAAGADKVITVDLHSMQTQGFFDIYMKNISAMPLFADYFKSKGDLDNFIVVSPDFGGKNRAKLLAKALGTELSCIDKERLDHSEAKARGISVDVRGKNCILIDDMIDTAGTITEAVKILKQQGAEDVYICATHGIFSGDAYENIRNCPVKEVIVTDTLPLKKGAPDNIIQLSIARMIADEIAL